MDEFGAVIISMNKGKSFSSEVMGFGYERFVSFEKHSDESATICTIIKFGFIRFSNFK